LKPKRLEEGEDAKEEETGKDSVTDVVPIWMPVEWLRVEGKRKRRGPIFG